MELLETSQRNNIEPKVELQLQRRMIAPVEHLPAEILSEIFIICSMVERMAPMVIASVCRWWRETICLTSRAWIRISLRDDSGRKTSSACRSIFLNRSSPHLVHIRAEYYPRLWDDSMSKFRFSFKQDDDLKSIIDHATRILCVSVDCQSAHTLAGNFYPHLTRLVITDQEARQAYSFSLNLSQLPNLRYLDIAEELNYKLDLSNLDHVKLQSLSMHTGVGGIWLRLVTLCRNTLRTLRLAYNVDGDATRTWTVDLPKLENFLLSDCTADQWGAGRATIELDTPPLRFYGHISYNKKLQVVHKSDLKQVTQARYNLPIQLDDYPQLRILQLGAIDAAFGGRSVLESILQQLESNLERCAYLHTIEVLMYTMRDSSDRNTPASNAQERISDRNRRAGSNIRVIFGNKWHFDVPDEHGCDDGMPCKSSGW